MLYIMLRKYKSWYLLCYTLHYIQIDLSAAPCNSNKVAFISFMRCCHIFHQSTAIEKISELIILLVEANWCSTVPLQCTVPPSQFYLLLLSCGLVMLLTVKILKIRSPDTIGLIHFDGMITGVEAWIIFHFCLQYLIQLMGIVIFQTLRSTGDGFSPQQKLDEIADWRNCCCSSEGTFCVLWNISKFHYQKCFE